MSKGQKITSGATNNKGVATAKDLVLPTYFRPVDPPQAVKWSLHPTLNKKIVVDAQAIARSHDTILMTVVDSPPYPGNQAVWSNYEVPQTVYWAKPWNIEGLPEEPELDRASRLQEEQRRSLNCHAKSPVPVPVAPKVAPLPLPAHAFNIRKVRMSEDIKAICSILLADATMETAEEFATHLTDPLYCDIVEGGYIQPDGVFTARGIMAAERDIGSTFVRKHLEAIAAKLDTSSLRPTLSSPDQSSSLSDSDVDWEGPGNL